MKKRYKVLAPVEPYNSGKTVWTQCGMAYEEANGITVQLVALPLQQYWNGRFLIKEDTEEVTDA
jgi:hypothetical protein